ncbi:MAG TPA: helix-turn-helix transcriptional regulator [Gemmatimonadaceae bacterium]|nr:helix-turn-helix transcriptional regulator [Gemmatimonadaceae bacterium]
MGTTINEKFRIALRVELAKAGLTQRALARSLNIPDTTFSDWVRGAHPAPPGFAARVAKELGVSESAFT